MTRIPSKNPPDHRRRVDVIATVVPTPQIRDERATGPENSPDKRFTVVAHSKVVISPLTIGMARSFCGSQTAPAASTTVNGRYPK
jgi:hypothetical protein